MFVWGLSAHGQMGKHLDDLGGIPAAEVADDREPRVHVGTLSTKERRSPARGS